MGSPDNLVAWTNRSLGLCCVSPQDIRKCSETEVLRVGDAVTAARRLTFEESDEEGCHVEIGALGTLRQLTPTNTVAWTNRNLGLCRVTPQDIRKCSAIEYLRVGDIVKATRVL